MALVTALITTAFIGGLLMHSYIAITVIIRWLHKKPVTPIDQVLVCLGIARMLLQIFSLMDLFLSIYQHGYLEPGSMFHFAVDGSFIFFNYSSIWFSTLFCVTFLLKIATYRHRLFLRLKRIVSQRITSLIVLSLVVSFGYVLMYVYLLTTDSGVKNMTDVINNVTNVTKKLQSRVHHVVFFLLGNSIPIGIYCCSVTLLIASLYFHIDNMRANSNSAPLRLKAYYMAITTLAFCLLCYIFTVISNVFVLCYIFMLEVFWIHIILNVFPIIHSAFLICKTSYLRQ
ncbi:hypothetical protein GDO78_016305, partial [Eleutherodactylus coqui]